MVSNNTTTTTSGISSRTVDDEHAQSISTIRISTTDHHHHHHHELSPLLLGQVSTISSSFAVSSDEDDDEPGPGSDDFGDEPRQPQHGHQQGQQQGTASMFRTVMSLMKVCLGTGCLALPYACRQGGILAYLMTLSCVAVWNLYAVHRLIGCLHYCSMPEYNSSCCGYSSSSIIINGKEQQEDSHVKDHEEEAVNPPPIHRHGCGTSNSCESSSSSSSKDDDEDEVLANYNNNNKNKKAPPDNTATLGKVAWYAFGQPGLECLDVMMTILLMGVVVSYLVAIIEFMSDVLLSVGVSSTTAAAVAAVADEEEQQQRQGVAGPHYFIAVLAACVIAGLSLVPNVGFLSRFSVIGLVTLTATFLVIAGYGLVYDFDDNNDTSRTTTTTTPVAAAAVAVATAAATTTPLALWPITYTGFSHMYGVCLFGYGFVPLTYNFRDSMRQPERFVTASSWALVGVTVVNAVIGIGLYALFPHVAGEILHELPSSSGGILPTITRLAMAVVVIMTAPLLVVPMAELLEGKWHVDSNNTTARGGCGGRCKVRFGICLVSAMIAVLFPGFVQVLSLVGCAFVGLLSLCVPPILFLRLRYMKHYGAAIRPRQHQQHQHLHQQHSHGAWSLTAIFSLWRAFGVDAILAAAGLVATIAGTISILSEW
jgi:amino acid permease